MSKTPILNLEIHVYNPQKRFETNKEIQKTGMALHYAQEYIPTQLMIAKNGILYPGRNNDLDYIVAELPIKENFNYLSRTKEAITYNNSTINGPYLNIEKRKTRLSIKKGQLCMPEIVEIIKDREHLSNIKLGGLIRAYFTEKSIIKLRTPKEIEEERKNKLLKEIFENTKSF